MRAGYLPRVSQKVGRSPEAEVAVLVEVEHACLVRLLAGLQRARKLVVAVRLDHLSLLLEAAAERVVGIVVDRRQLERCPELRLCLVVPAEAKIGDAERLADRCLVRRAALRLLERHGRLRGLALAEPLAAFLKVVVDVAHMPFRYPKFSTTKSTGCVKSRV